MGGLQTLKPNEIQIRRREEGIQSRRKTLDDEVVKLKGRRRCKRSLRMFSLYIQSKYNNNERERKRTMISFAH